jgi:hypothetical protein
MGETCSTHGRDEKLIRKFQPESLKKEDNFGDLGVDERITLRSFLRKHFLWV